MHNDIIDFIATSILHSEKLHPKMIKDLKLIKDLLENFSIDWFLIKGSLLGCIRNSKFIPWDDNVNIAVSPKSYYKLLDAFKEADIVDNYSVKNNRIFFFSNMLISLNSSLKCYVNIHKYTNFFDTNIKTNYLEGITVNIPANWDEHLTQLYGKNYVNNYQIWNHHLDKDFKETISKQELDNLFTGTVITFGTYDLFHEGHYNLLKRASYIGNRLIVGVSSDGLNLKKKGRKPIFNEEFRSDLINCLEFVDGVFLEESLELKEHYIKSNFGTKLVMGSDWKGRFDDFKDICQIIYFERTQTVSTTNLIEYIKNNDNL